MVLYDTVLYCIVQYDTVWLYGTVCHCVVVCDSVCIGL